MTRPTQVTAWRGGIEPVDASSLVDVESVPTMRRTVVELAGGVPRPAGRKVVGECQHSGGRIVRAEPAGVLPVRLIWSSHSDPGATNMQAWVALKNRRLVGQRDVGL